MNGDISLSQTLGGLRIANPDDDDETASPSPPPVATSDSSTYSNSSAERPRPSSHSSASTVTARPRASTAVPESTSPPPVGNPQLENPPTITSTTLRHSPTQRGDNAIHNARFSRGPGPTSMPMPLGHQAQQQVQFPTSSQPRSYPPPSAGAGRPISGLYSHANVSSSSATSGSSYRYRDEPIPPPQPPNIGMQRTSSSRKSAAAMQAAQAGVASQDFSYTDRAYLQNQALHGGNGPAPPRRSSRRISPANMAAPGNALPPQVGPSAYGLESNGPPPSSEEWKERGAAVGVRQEVDANGQIVNRPMKKGVKDFNFGRTLGEGSYSTVLAATDRQTMREYAIKVLDKKHIIKEKKVKYVNIEKDTLNRLTDHPGIVRLYYTFQDERSLYFVLDLASGGELLGVLKQYTTFDEECTRFYSAEILDAVDYMHRQGVIHRDLKPENVLLDSHMHVKITDFGTAKILDPPKNEGIGIAAGDPMDGANTDRAMSFVGTAEYVSPELLTEKNACKASDLWAFGCIIYQLLAGRPPFKASNEYQTFQKIVALDYVFPDGFPESARDLVERLLVLDPAQRLPMEHIKNHQFFAGVTWGKGLWKLKAPRLKSYTAPAQEPIRLNGPSSAAASSSQLRPQPRVITELPPPSQLDIEWSPVLTRNNERILKLGNLIVTSAPPPHSPGEPSKTETPNKFQRFFGSSTLKKRQRLVMVTSSAHLVMAAAGGDEKKAKMDINLMTHGCSWKSYKDSKGLTVWCLDTVKFTLPPPIHENLITSKKDKHYVFEDPKATTADPDGSKYSTAEWMDSLERARDLALSHSLSNSYSGDSGLNDLSSTMSSPNSTLGVQDQIEGVNIPIGTRHLMRKKDRRDETDNDGESVRSLGGKGRKRFSRRQSKNGLAAVF
ncbi:Pkinase-domain-containing protein [Rhizodiscina lignyota]|uniref:non-specific serine/threonine protein kinase n=1 Tax=Rhizodiscina lignyota TaxID=1504668 RepID=A0A9P4M740_9PEZI|nr:Pkinase-domain-containing protein [Rhizodiscina lignyota]